MAISRPLGATSRVIFELKPFGISIRGANGSQPWVGRSTAQMSGNPSDYHHHHNSYTGELLTAPERSKKHLVHIRNNPPPLPASSHNNFGPLLLFRLFHKRWRGQYVLEGSTRFSYLFCLKSFVRH